MFGIDDAFMIGALANTGASLLGAFTSKRVDTPRSAQDEFFEELCTKYRNLSKRRAFNKQLASMISGRPLKEFSTELSSKDVDNVLKGSSLSSGSITKWGEKYIEEGDLPSKGDVLSENIKGMTRESGSTSTLVGPSGPVTPQTSTLTGQGASRGVGGYNPIIEKGAFNKISNAYDFYVRDSSGRKNLDEWLSTDEGKSWYAKKENKSYLDFLKSS